LSLFELNKALSEANAALGRVDEQVSDIEELLESSEEIPEELKEAATALSEDLDSLRQDLGEVGGNARVSSAIDGSTTRPTADQLWQMEQAWEKAPTLLEQLNTFITDRLPALYDRLNEHGVRPDPGEAIVVPRRPGGRQ
jgi:ABC-type transporter Mla subunit MlaD